MRKLLLILALVAAPAAANAFCIGNQLICEQRDFERNLIQALRDQDEFNKWSEERRSDSIRREQGLLPRAQADAQDTLRRQAEWIERCKPRIVTGQDGIQHRAYAAPGCEAGPKP